MSYFGKPTKTSDEQTQPFAPVDAGQPDPIEAGDPIGAGEPIAAREPIAAGEQIAAREPIAMGEPVESLRPIQPPVYAGQAFQPGEPEEDEQPRSLGSRLAGFRDRVTRALQGLDRGPAERRSLEAPEPTHHEVLAEVPARTEDMRLPIGPLGYSRTVVDERIAALEEQITALEQERHIKPGVSITDEIERLGEQTASILVVAHDQAHETTRQAQEQAERCIADATVNAHALTADAKRRLEEIDSETDLVWQERSRLLDDARNVGLALIALAEEAVERFPPEVKTTEASQVTE